MTPEEFKTKTILRARDLLERHAATQEDVKLNARTVAYYGAYYLGAIQAVQRVVSDLLNRDTKPKGDDWVYLKAQWDFISSSKRRMQLFLDGTEMRFRNHQRDKKGHLTSVECYFVERHAIITEKK